MIGVPPSTCGLLVPGRTSGDLEIAVRTCLAAAITIFMSPEATMVRYCSIMTTIVEGAGRRSRDFARHAAPRPGSRDQDGAVSVFGRLQQRLRSGDRVHFCTKVIDVWLSNTDMINADMAPEKAHNKDIEYERKTGIVSVAWCDT